MLAVTSGNFLVGLRRWRHRQSPCLLTSASAAGGSWHTRDRETGGIPVGLRLVWSDEFDVAGLPIPDKWSYDTERNSAGWYNNELQYYSAMRASRIRASRTACW